MNILIDFAIKTLAIVGVYYIIDRSYDAFVIGDGIFTRISSFISRRRNRSREELLNVTKNQNP